MLTAESKRRRSARPPAVRRGPPDRAPGRASSPRALDHRAGAAEIDLALLQRQVEAAGERLVAADGLAQGAWHLVAQMDGDGLALGLDRNVRRLQHGVEEAGHILAAADGGAHALQLRRDGLRAQRVLGEAGAAGLLAVAGVLPLGVDGLLLRLEVVDEVERQLLRHAPLVFSRNSAPSNSASAICSLEPGTATVTPRSLLMLLCLRISTSRITPSIGLSVP